MRTRNRLLAAVALVLAGAMLISVRKVFAVNAIQPSSVVSNGIQATSTPASSEGLAPSRPAGAHREFAEESVNPEGLAAGTVTYFKRYPGVAFQPRDSDTGYDYFGNGCISSKGSDYFTVDLQLPTGAVIDFIRLYYYDASSANARMYLSTYDAAGSYTDVDYVDSSGTGGYGSAGIFTNYTVDPITEAVVLVWRPNTTGATMALCGARVRFQATFGLAFLPLISR